MEMVYAPIIAKAKEKGLPMIDLPNTFDIRNDKLYCSQIEPSEQGGEIISQLIAHIVKNHPQGKHCFYYMDQGQIKSY